MQLHQSLDGPRKRPAPPAREAFDHEVAFTVGVEEELLLVDPVTHAAAPEAASALAAVAGDPRFCCELRPEQVELVTPVCATAAEAGRELAAARALLVERLGGALRLVGAGTHPLTATSPRLSPGARYRRIEEHARWCCHHGQPCGLHVHVAVPGADRALAVLNALRSYLPELAALSANSPFFDGADTGFASFRSVLNAGLGRCGVPPAFASWDELDAFVRWGARGGAWEDASYLWWLLRPNLAHGTIELRVADAQARVRDAAALAAVCQALVATLAARHDAGERLPVADTARIQENVYRASRDGMDAVLLDLETGEPVPARERLAQLVLDAAPAAAALGCGETLAEVWSLLRRTGADEQRSVVELDGLDALVPWLVEQTESTGRVPRGAGVPRSKAP